MLLNKKLCTQFSVMFAAALVGSSSFGGDGTSTALITSQTFECNKASYSTKPNPVSEDSDGLNF